MAPSSPFDGALATRTHARLRVAQGDVAGAIELLQRLLERCPADRETELLLERLRREPGAPRTDEAEEVFPAPALPGDAGELAVRFRAAFSRPRRIARLQGWLARITARG
jgi:hypothetical protein